MAGLDGLPRLRPHAVQSKLYRSQARFNVGVAGRRSGKTFLAKLKVRREALSKPGAWFVCAGPTNDQARNVFWEQTPSLKDLFHDDEVEKVREVPPTIMLRNGTRITVVGMDKPQRIRGIALDGIVLDEYATMKPNVWAAVIRPLLSDPSKDPGWAWFIGTPEGRNHFWDIYKSALSDDTGTWGAFTWPSADIMDPAEVESARRELDEKTFQQEFEASFIDFVGRAYYPFTVEEHCRPLEYVPNRPLIFCFDFNLAPGVAAVVQEQHEGERSFTAVIGQVWIPSDSNTPRVCAKLIQDWGHHKGPVICYGDYSGGTAGTSSVQGSDWDLIAQALRKHWKSVHIETRPNPKQRARINAVNSRLKSVDGDIRMYVDPKKASRVVDDLEGVTLLKGGSGELDKKPGDALTHISDGLGYYIHQRFPVTAGPDTVTGRI